MVDAAPSMHELLSRTTKPGHVVWIGVRPDRRAPMKSLETEYISEMGLDRDRSKPGKRAVTLIQAEHLLAIGSFLGVASIEPKALRRNLVVEGINLLALRGREIRVGDATLLITGPCAPCSRIEEAFGRGGYSAVRGHGGVTAQVIKPGPLELGSPVSPVD
ncbi:MAG: MOSC domain-containing protein [Pseudomonadota bacterium]